MKAAEQLEPSVVVWAEVCRYCGVTRFEARFDVDERDCYVRSETSTLRGTLVEPAPHIFIPESEVTDAERARWPE